MIKSTLILAFLVSSYGCFNSDVPKYQLNIISWSESIKIASGIPLNVKWSYATKLKYANQIEAKLKYYKEKSRRFCRERRHGS